MCPRVGFDFRGELKGTLMTRMVVCVIALAAASVGQEQGPKPGTDTFDRVAAQDPAKPSSGEIPSQPAAFAVDRSEVTPIPQPGQKGAVATSRSKPSAALDMRPAAVCARDMNDVLDKLNADKTYLAGMEQPEREDLYKHALDCLFLQQGTMALRRTAVVLEETRLYIGFFRGVDSGISQASELEQAAIERIKNADEGTRESIVHHYDALVDRYNALANDYNNHDAALVNRYNSLVNDYNGLLGLAQQLAAAPPARSSFSLMPPSPPPPRELHLTCSASPLSGNMATVNCW